METCRRFKLFLIRIITFDYFFVKRIIKKEVYPLNKFDVLDLGCGVGVLSPLFGKRRYFGVDLNPSSIKIARKTSKGYKFAIGNAVELHLDKKFDLVLVVGVIHHLNEKEAKKTLLNIKKHLRTRGRLLMVEAIPPISKFNLLGFLLRKLDEGKHIRKLDYYHKIVSKGFRITKSYPEKGGLVDYAVIVAKNN